MKLYKITIEIDGMEKVARWSGYNDQCAIAQCFLFEAQNGALNIKVLEVIDLY